MKIGHKSPPVLGLVAREGPLVIGHRGGCARAPENTLASFNFAIKAGAELVELDYRHSKDGVPLVIHDATLDRTTDARKRWRRVRIRVETRTAAEIETLDAGSWFHVRFAGTKVPRLADALDLICGHDCVAVIEHKSGDAETLLKVLRRGNWTNKAVVISFDWKFLRALHEMEPGQAIGALGPPSRLSNGRKPNQIRRRLLSRLHDLEKTGARVAVWNRRLSNRDIQAAHRRGLHVWVYTVDTPRLARRFTTRGVDGIITNEVGKICQEFTLP